MKVQKIVFVIESLQVGGAEKSLVTLLNNLDKRRYNIHLVLFKNDGLFMSQVPPHVNIVYKNIQGISIFARFKYKLKKSMGKTKFHNAQLFWPIVKKFVVKNDENYDIAVAYNQGFVTYYTAEFITAKKKIAWINTDYQKAGYNSSFDFPFYKKYDVTVAVSNEVKNSLQTELKKINKTLFIEVIQDISDKNQILELARAKQEIEFKTDGVKIVTVARLAKAKGIDLAVKSCKILINKGYNVSWYVVGEGPERPYLQKLIKLNRLEHAFFLLGVQLNPYPYIKNCDIYVQTSYFEGLGLTVIEATYLNKPIVCTNFNSVYGIVENEKTGLIAEMNPQSIGFQIEKLINNNNLRMHFSTTLAAKVNSDKENSLKKIEIVFNRE